MADDASSVCSDDERRVPEHVTAIAKAFAESKALRQARDLFGGVQSLLHKRILLLGCP